MGRGPRRPYFALALMAEVRRRQGDLFGAVATVERALAEGESVGECFWQGICAGELMAAGGAQTAAGPAEWFRRSLAVAEAQDARGL